MAGAAFALLALYLLSYASLVQPNTSLPLSRVLYFYEVINTLKKTIFFVAALVLIGCAQGHMQVKRTKVPANEVRDELKAPVSPSAEKMTRILERAKEGREILSDSAGYEVDYGDESLEWISEALPGSDENLVLVIGPFYGEAIINRLGGEWVMVGKEPSIKLPNGMLIFPYGKVHKNLINGSEDSIFHFFKYLEGILSQ